MLRHRIGRVLLFLQSLELGLPQPLTRRRLCLPPVLGGGAHSLARGLGESQFRRGHTLWYSLYISTVPLRQLITNSPILTIFVLYVPESTSILVVLYLLLW
jgi:hypothetical protein